MLHMFAGGLRWVESKHWKERVKFQKQYKRNISASCGCHMCMPVYGLKPVQGKKCAEELQFFFLNTVYTDAWRLILIKASNRERIFLLP